VKSKTKTGIALSLTMIIVLALVTIAQSNALAITPYWQGRYNGEASGKADNRDALATMLLVALAFQTTTAVATN
jgi:hypothetical protein